MEGMIFLIIHTCLMLPILFLHILSLIREDPIYRKIGMKTSIITWQIFLGARECPAYIEPGDMSEPGYYDDKGTLSFGLMYHSLCYPNQNDEGNLYSRFWHPQMENGIIHFCRPEECENTIFLRKGTKKELSNIPILGVDKEELLSGYQEGGELQ